MSRVLLPGCPVGTRRVSNSQSLPGRSSARSAPSMATEKLSLLPPRRVETGYVSSTAVCTIYLCIIDCRPEVVISPDCGRWMDDPTVILHRWYHYLMWTLDDASRHLARRLQDTYYIHTFASLRGFEWQYLISCIMTVVIICMTTISCRTPVVVNVTDRLRLCCSFYCDLCCLLLRPSTLNKHVFPVVDGDSGRYWEIKKEEYIITLNGIHMCLSFVDAPESSNHHHVSPFQAVAVVQYTF